MPDWEPMNSKDREAKKVPAPRLRFPGFDGEWEEKKLGEVAAIKGGWAFPDKYQGKTEGEILAVKVSDMNLVGNETCIKTAANYLSRDDIKAMRAGFISQPSIIFAKVGAAMMLNRRRMVTLPTMIDNNIMAVTSLPEKVNLEYLYYASMFWDFKKFTQEGVVPSINQSQVANFDFPLPPTLLEQTRIAAALSSLDAVIAAHQSKQDALREHKRGLMAGLFPAEGERVPRLRFPEFEGAGEWEEKKLGEISDIKTGPFGSVLHQEDYVTEGTPIVTVEHLGEFGLLGENAPKVSAVDAKRLSSYKIKTGDIVFSRVGSVDRCSIARPENNGWLFSGRLLRLRIINRSEHTSEFLNQLLKIESSKSKIRNAAVGQTMASLNTEILKHIAFLFPSLPEQTRIAAALSSLDDLITAQGDHIAALQTFKRGLMQGLFPRSGEE